MTPRLLAQLGVLFLREAEAGGFWHPRTRDERDESARLDAIADELFARARSEGFRGNPFARERRKRITRTAAE